MKNEQTDHPYTQSAFGIHKMQRKVRDWIRALHQDPSEEERAIQERRARLLEELNRAVSETPDDVPIRDVIARLNHHSDD